MRVPKRIKRIFTNRDRRKIAYYRLSRRNGRKIVTVKDYIMEPLPFPNPLSVRPNITYSYMLELGTYIFQEVKENGQMGKTLWRQLNFNPESAGLSWN